MLKAVLKVKRYVLSGVARDNILRVALDCNLAYAQYQAKVMLAKCQSVTISQNGKEIETVSR